MVSRKMKRLLGKRRTTKHHNDGKRIGIFGLDDIICAAVGLVAGIAVFLTASSFSTINRYIDLQSSESSYYKILNLQEEGTMYMETALGFVLQWAVNNTAGYGGLNNETARKEWLDENYDVKKKEAEIPVPKGVDVPICQTCDPATEMFDYLKMLKPGKDDTTAGDTGDCLKAKPNADGRIEMPDSKYYTKTPPFSEEWTTPELCIVVYQAAKDYFEKYDEKITVNDFSDVNLCGKTFPPHATHQCGEDVDLIGPMCVAGANHAKSVFLAEALITRTEAYKDIKGPAIIIFNDNGVQDEVNKWASSKHYTGHVVQYEGHEDHFHFDIDRDGNRHGLSYGANAANSPDCCKK